MEKTLETMQQALNEIKELRDRTWTNDTGLKAIDTLQVAIDELREQIKQ